MLFKVAAWFIIVISLGSLICCSVRCVFHGCGNRDGCERMEQCGIGRYEEEEMCGRGFHGKFNKRVMICKGEAGRCGSDSYRGEGKACCKDKMGCEEEKDGCVEGETKCCDKGKGDVEIKDTIVVKRKLTKEQLPSVKGD